MNKERNDKIFIFIMGALVGFMLCLLAYWLQGMPFTNTVIHGTLL